MPDEGDELWEAFDGRPHELRMGLRPLDPARWLRLPPPPGLTSELDRKERLLASRPNDVLATIDDDTVGPAAAELAHSLIDHLLTHHGDRYRRRGGLLTLADDGRSWDTDGHDPLNLAGRIVSEDWCLVRPGRPPVLAGATLCSPNRWRLAEKLGRPLTEVHGPVPGYGAKLAPPVDALFAGSRGPTWRRNWSIQSSPSRFQPVADGPDQPSIPEQVWVRSEYETVVRLPSTGWWVFGIHTTVRPIAELVERPALAAKVLTAVRNLDPAMAAYKDLAGFGRPLAAWLESISNAP